MHCYTAHKRIISFMKIMKHMDNSICVYLSSVLVRMCCKAKLSKAIYSEVCKERFKFQFSVELMTDCCKIIEADGKISATGYSFRDKSDAIESGALSMLDLLTYRYGIRSALYSDLVFIQDWPAHNHISVNLKETCSALLGITSEVSSLIKSISDCGNLFEAEKSKFTGGIRQSSEIDSSAALVAILNDCCTELQTTCQSLSADISEHTERVRWRCQSHRFHHKGYYEAVHSVHKDLDIKMECIDTLMVTLDKVCERSGYSLEGLSSVRASDDGHTAEIVLIKRSNSVLLEKSLIISGARCRSIDECQRDAIYRAINAICVREGLKIIDAGYLDLRDMQKESREFKHEVPLLCNTVAKMKVIIEHGFRNIDTLGQQYYRCLRDAKFCKELRLSLADCINDFIYIIRAFDEEVKKMEIYSSNLGLYGRDTETF